MYLYYTYYLEIRLPRLLILPFVRDLNQWKNAYSCRHRFLHVGGVLRYRQEYQRVVLHTICSCPLQTHCCEAPVCWCHWSCLSSTWTCHKARAVADLQGSTCMLHLRAVILPSQESGSWTFKDISLAETCPNRIKFKLINIHNKYFNDTLSTNSNALVIGMDLHFPYRHRRYVLLVDNNVSV